MQKLTILDLSNNSLKHLPENLGSLARLKIMKMKGNKNLKNLPKSICQVQSLILLDLDCDNFVYPPVTVVQKGTENIIKFICDGIKIANISKTRLKREFFRYRLPI